MKKLLTTGLILCMALLLTACSNGGDGIYGSWASRGMDSGMGVQETAILNSDGIPSLMLRFNSDGTMHVYHGGELAVTNIWESQGNGQYTFIVETTGNESVACINDDGYLVLVISDAMSEIFERWND